MPQFNNPGRTRPLPVYFPDADPHSATSAQGRGISPSAPERAALIDRLRPVFRRCVELECRSRAGGVRQPQSFPQGARVTEGTPRERHEVSRPRDVAVRSSSRAWLDDPFNSPILFVDCRFLICSESVRISASNARMHFSLVACGLSALISPHDGHTATVCELETSRLSTAVDHWSKVLAAENAAPLSVGVSTTTDTSCVNVGQRGQPTGAGPTQHFAPRPSTQIDRSDQFGWSETAISTLSFVSS